MAIHDHLHRRHPEGIVDVVDRIVKREVSTVYEVVYTTASPTFTDAIAGYSTVGATDNTDDSAPTSTPEPTPAEASSTSTPAVIQAAKSSSKSSSAVPKTTLSTSVSSLPSSIPYTSTTLPTTLAIAAASGKASSDTASSHATGTSGSAASAVSGTSSGTSTSSADSSSEGGMSTAGTAGLVVGILLLLGAVLAIVLLCFRKRRKAAGQERAEDEKHEFAAMERHASTRTTATAPRLSLRPVTQFLPNLNVKRASRGNDLLAVSENGNTREIDRPSTAHSQNPANPFGNHAQSPASMPENPFGAEAHVVSPDSSVTPDSPIDAANANGPEVVDDFTGEEIIVGAALGGDAASGSPALKRSVSKRGIAPSPMDFTKSGPFMGPPSPVGTEFSMTSDASVAPLQTGGGAAIAAAGGPASSTVHRVQLDFFPSMEDELDLRQGSLVRLLHEYDDGWALCIRLDRSKQGVVPRTCLSARPVKPRPMPKQNGPRGNSPNMRGPPQGSPRGMTPNGGFQRPMTPNGSRMPTGPLPSTPDGRNSPLIAQSPASSTSSSPSHPSHLNVAHNQIPIERKPLPGQAL